MYFVYEYENRTMKLVKIVLKSGGERMGKNDGGGKSN
jgi:hypothetical protein